MHREILCLIQISCLIQVLSGAATGYQSTNSDNRLLGKFAFPDSLTAQEIPSLRTSRDKLQWLDFVDQPADRAGDLSGELFGSDLKVLEEIQKVAMSFEKHGPFRMCDHPCRIFRQLGRVGFKSRKDLKYLDSHNVIHLQSADDPILQSATCRGARIIPSTGGEDVKPIIAIQWHPCLLCSTINGPRPVLNEPVAENQLVSPRLRNGEHLDLRHAEPAGQTRREQCPSGKHSFFAVRTLNLTESWTECNHPIRSSRWKSP